MKKRNILKVFLLISAILTVAISSVVSLTTTKSIDTNADTMSSLTK